MSSIKMEMCTSESSIEERHMEAGNTSGLTENLMRASGTRDANMDTECGEEHKGIHMSDSGRTVLHMGLVHRYLHKGISTKVSGYTL